MKKLLMIWMIGLTMMLVSCDKTSEFDKAVTHFNELDSVAIEMVTEIVGLGDPVTVTMEIDGQNSKIDVLDETIYQYMEDGHYYMLVPFGDQYTSEEIDLEEAMGFDALTFSEDDDALFRIENFEEVTEEIDGVDVTWYVYQGDDLDVDTFKFSIEDDMIHQMVFETEESFLDVMITMTFSEYDNVTVTMPEEFITDEIYQQALDLFVENGFDMMIEPTYLEAVHGNTLLHCDFDEDICTFDEYPESWEFSPDGDLFNYRDMGLTSLDALYEEADLEISQATFQIFFDVIDLLYR